MNCLDLARKQTTTRCFKTGEIEETRGLRIVAYSPDSYGLGHVRRSISITGAVLGKVHGSSVLLLTGAPRAHYFDYPDRCDYVKIPSITKDTGGRYICRDLDLSLEEALLMRSRLIQMSVQGYDADVLLVDHSPLGLGGEIVPTLQTVRNSTVRVLGMRDVIDDPARVRAAWAKNGTIDVLRQQYDHIMVYGQRRIFDVVSAYGLPDEVAEKTTYVGYVPRNGRHCDPDTLRAHYAPRTGRLVVVTVGGGGDGNLPLRAFLDGFAGLGEDPPFEVVAVTGPLMSPRKRKAFQKRVAELGGVTILEFTDALPDLLEAADLTVSMGGYNTICELACAGARALILPRTNPRTEQLVRAKLLAERGLLTCLENDHPDPGLLIDRVLDGLDAPRPPRGWGLRFSALQRSVEVLERLTGSGRKKTTAIRRKVVRE